MAMLEYPENSGSFDPVKVYHSKLQGESKWADVKDLINRWANRNRQGALLQEQWLREARETLIDEKHGKWKATYSGENLKRDADTRFSLLMHPELMNYIETFYPDMFSTKEGVHEFMYRFPKFKVRQQIGY